MQIFPYFDIQNKGWSQKTASTIIHQKGYVFHNKKVANKVSLTKYDNACIKCMPKGRIEMAAIVNGCKLKLDQKEK